MSLRSAKGKGLNKWSSRCSLTVFIFPNHHHHHKWTIPPCSWYRTWKVKHPTSKRIYLTCKGSIPPLKENIPLLKENSPSFFPWWEPRLAGLLFTVKAVLPWGLKAAQVWGSHSSVSAWWNKKIGSFRAFLMKSKVLGYWAGLLSEDSD